MGKLNNVMNRYLSDGDYVEFTGNLDKGTIE